eukprot:CAMPEP_0168438428 /NCGR_PEP_ID=MMETSP0228-20121227/41956_1 /TAXON_ID=133427 /ORGANISM="Protoceratium reticulatum, Strain CCCM 535 (=CCMP 1889)" /LENGTH=159 /DNA_ID=CAMNT_0008452695 /DNA_START=11 /DNA_END=488 /DNA_ORIENTATION=-
MYAAWGRPSPVAVDDAERDLGPGLGGPGLAASSAVAVAFEEGTTSYLGAQIRNVGRPVGAVAQDQLLEERLRGLLEEFESLVKLEGLYWLPTYSLYLPAFVDANLRRLADDLGDDDGLPLHELHAQWPGLEDLRLLRAIGQREDHLQRRRHRGHPAGGA